MQLDFAILSDAAHVTGGRLYMLGGAIDTLRARELPVVVPHLTLVMRFILSSAEVELAHKLVVVIIDSDGKKIANVNGQLKIQGSQPVDPLKPARPILPLNLINVKFERFGSYAIEVLVNGSSMKSLPLEILPVKKAPQAQPNKGAMDA